MSGNIVLSCHRDYGKASNHYACAGCPRFHPDEQASRRVVASAAREAENCESTRFMTMIR